MEKNIILVGLGPHARRIYYPLLEKYAKSHQLNLTLVVDVQDQQDKICTYLAGRPLQPEKLFFIESNQRNRPNLEGQLQAMLDQLVLEQRIDGVIISTEAKAHKPYLLWAIERNLDVLVDKPIVAPCGLTTHREAARQIYTDYLEIETKLRQSRSNVIVQCQRRSHPGYRFVKTYLTEFIQQYQIPLSYLDIYHADGMWCMPPELFQRENHPYKYGYGKLMHSGYHFIDLWAWLAETNNLLESKKPTELDLFVKRFGPADFLHQVNPADYQRLLQTDNYQPYFSPEMRQTAQQFGELDVYILGQLKRAGAVVTTATINLQQNSFSRRAWANPPEDVYKGNGRVRHERLNLQVGNLLNMQVHSYQAYEVGKKDVETSGSGHEDHFDINIFRNSGVVGGQPLEKLTIGETERRQQQDNPFYLGHNESAREIHFLDFIEGRPGASHFAAHRLTNQLLSRLYECIVSENNGGIPYLSGTL